MNNIMAFFLGSLLMIFTLMVLYCWVVLLDRRPYVIERGDLVCITGDGRIRKAVVGDKRVIGVAMENGVIQTNGTFLVKVDIGDKN